MRIVGSVTAEALHEIMHREGSFTFAPLALEAWLKEQILKGNVPPESP